MVSPEIALFRAFPALRERLPRYPVLAGPTPVERLSLEGLASQAVFVKRDDRSCPLYGGNKPRKLEWLIGAARARGARRLVTTGGLGTHHGLATTILGREAGLATTLVLVHQPVTEAVGRSLLLDSAYGADLVYAANVPGAAACAAGVLAASTWRGERPYLVATGGSSRRGGVGFVNAGLEFAEQVREGLAPQPAEIYLPVGSGGTFVGLVAGLKLAGLDSRVVGVLVTDILPPTSSRLARSARRLIRWLRRLDPSLPALRFSADDFPLVREQLGAGYGEPTDAARRALAVAKSGGLHLEITYTGKCLAEMLARAQRGALPTRPVIFWNTFNSVDVEARAPRPPDATALPPRLRRVLDERLPPE